MIRGLVDGHDAFVAQKLADLHPADVGKVYDHGAQGFSRRQNLNEALALVVNFPALCPEIVEHSGGSP